MNKNRFTVSISAGIAVVLLILEQEPILFSSDTFLKIMTPILKFSNLCGRASGMHYNQLSIPSNAFRVVI